MSLLQTMMKLLGGRREIDDLPFEELAREFATRPREVYREFIRRLQALVFEAVLDFRDRAGLATDQAAVDGDTIALFDGFAHSFASGSPETVLVRFGDVIMRRLDRDAFQGMAYRYFHLIPIYHINDERDRRLAAAVYEEGVAPDLVQSMSRRFQMSEPRTRAAIARANKTLQRTIAKEFSPAELRAMTAGWLP